MTISVPRRNGRLAVESAMERFRDFHKTGMGESHLMELLIAHQMEKGVDAKRMSLEIRQPAAYSRLMVDGEPVVTQFQKVHLLEVSKCP